MNPLRRLLYFTPVFVTVLILVLLSGMNGRFAFLSLTLALPLLALLILLAAILALFAIRDYLKTK